MSTQTLKFATTELWWFAPCATCCRSAAELYLALNLSLSPLDLLQLHIQVFILHCQRLHSLMEAATLLLRPSQLVTVNLVLWDNRGYIEEKIRMLSFNNDRHFGNKIGCQELSASHLSLRVEQRTDDCCPLKDTV